MTDLRKAAEMALTSLMAWKEQSPQYWDYDDIGAVEALRQALAQPEKEPVALWNFNQGFSDCMIDKLNEAAKKNPAPLYTAPPSKPLIALTDEEIDDLDNFDFDGYGFPINFARAIEAKLREKNT